MSELRDARLQRALEHAPDEAPSPSDAVAQTVRRRARQALDEDRALAPRAVAAQPWWKTLWRASGSSSAPWSAAFATLVLAGFVTLLWQGQEIPGADPQDVPPAASAPVPAPAANQRPVPAESAAQETMPPAPSSPPLRQPPAQAKARADRAETQREAVAKQSAAPSADSAPNAFPAAPAGLPAPPVLSRPAPPPAPASPAATAGALGGAAEAEAGNRQESMAAPARDSRQRDAAAPAPPAALQRAAPAARAPVAEWQSATVTREGRVVQYGPEAAQRLGRAVRALVDSALPAAGAVVGSAPSLRIELRSGNDMEVLELAGDALRWRRRVGGVESDGTGAADRARLEALLAELAGLVPR